MTDRQSFLWQLFWGLLFASLIGYVIFNSPKEEVEKFIWMMQSF